MIRGLVIIAVGGAAFAAVAISASGAFHTRSWQFPGMSMFEDGDSDHGGRINLSGHEPRIERDLTWAGGSKLTFEVPAEIQFTQGPTSKITLSGPDVIVSHVVLDGDTIRLDRHVSGAWHNDDALKITITAPALHDFSLDSAQSLHISDLNTDSLAISINGAGSVTVAGQAKSADITLAGLGQANLADLTLGNARIEIDGLGHVKAGPTGNVRVEINGAGAVT
ncbi:MAG: DUF2807 domain-containing protein, partial [Acidocella sp.]|nr:DUF2807 domain-containing protein [Acidocella sp.]